MLLKQISDKDFETLGRLFSSKLGQEALDVLVRNFYDTISFTPGDTHTTAFKEGQRDIVQVLYQSVAHKLKKDKEKEDA